MRLKDILRLDPMSSRVKVSKAKKKKKRQIYLFRESNNETLFNFQILQSLPNERPFLCNHD